MRRTFWVPPRYHRLVSRVFEGRPVTQRHLAESLGYSLSGLRHAIDSLKEMGIIARVITTRGRFGRTIIRVARDISTKVSGYVPPTVRRDTKKRDIPVPVEGTYPEGGPLGEGYEVWKRLRETLFGASRTREERS
jgi:hypothetical protein